MSDPQGVFQPETWRLISRRQEQNGMRETWAMEITNEGEFPAGVMLRHSGGAMVYIPNAYVQREYETDNPTPVFASVVIRGYGPDGKMSGPDEESPQGDSTAKP